MRAESGWLKGLNPTVAIVSKSVIIVFVIFAVLNGETAAVWFNTVQKGILATLSWYYIGIVAFFLFFVIWLLFSPYGRIRLGADDERPRFSYFSWFAMLFGCGMGIGLVFWSIAEPIYHFESNPFVAEGLTPEAAQIAMRITFFHWGLHPWAIYVVVGLSLAFFAYRRDLPLTIRSSLHPIIGDRIYGPIGHAVDILAIFGTVFGVATSLGLGAKQMNTGLNVMFGMEVSLANQILLIAGITAIATLSVVSGVARGVKWLSVVNLWLSIAILVFFLAWGPTRYLLHMLVQSTGDYVQNIIRLSMWTDANKDTGWQGWWTAFYWGWWIAWAPFVGMFIARISRGRTVREFIAGVLLVPTLLAFVWLTLFGGTALHQELACPAGNVVAVAGETGVYKMPGAKGKRLPSQCVVEKNKDGFQSKGAGIVTAVKKDVTIALYTTFEKMDAGIMGKLAALVATLLIATYFITSSDSGTLVVNTILSVGEEEPPMVHRVFWGLSEGIVAMVLLSVGGLKALQAASIAAALPFSFIMLVMVYGLIRALRAEIAIIVRS